MEFRKSDRWIFRFQKVEKSTKNLNTKSATLNFTSLIFKHITPSNITQQNGVLRTESAILNHKKSG